MSNPLKIYQPQTDEVNDFADGGVTIMKDKVQRTACAKAKDD